MMLLAQVHPWYFYTCLTWLKSNTDIQFEILLLKGGPLESEFRKFGRVSIYQKLNKSLISRAAGKIKKHAFNIDQEKAFFSQFKPNNYDLIYGNTVVTIRALELLTQKVKVKTVLHVHELENIIKHYCGDTFPASKHYINKYIACSKLVTR